jgi:hypothetical protein
MVSSVEELRRIEGVGGASNAIGLTLTLIADCPNPAVVLARTKQVLQTVVSVRASRSEWPDFSEWERTLPAWFVRACQPAMSREAALAWLETWRSLPPEEQAAEEERQP